MRIVKAPVESVREVQDKIFLLQCYSPEIAREIKPGQFCNIKVSETTSPLLRRPFSICDVEGDSIFFMFNVYGEGTKLMSSKETGETIDILAPLGQGFNLNDDFDTAVIAAGGLGAAPFPYVTRKLKGKKIYSFIGGRTEKDVIRYGMENIFPATDDGSLGFHGNVVGLMNEKRSLFENEKVKIFACGPTPMLKSLQEFCLTNNLNCELSTETAMACGFGICQGCPIESTHQDESYMLVCKDGPVFNAKDVKL